MSERRRDAGRWIVAVYAIVGIEADEHRSSGVDG
jgi:hypothetical protein